MIMPKLSLETFVAVAPLLGQAQESRAGIREAQDNSLVDRLQAGSSVRLSSGEASGSRFYVAPLDILVGEGAGGRLRFQLAELNGTGIGGLTNMSLEAVGATLQSFSVIPGCLPESDEGSPPLVVIASSGREDRKNPRINRLFYEKVLYVEALKQGFETHRGEGVEITGWDLLSQRSSWRPERPAIVLGHLRELAEAMTCDEKGRLRLFGNPVTATVNDRFCLNVFNRFDEQVDLDRWFTANRCFLAGSDKGTAYGLSNRYLAGQAKGRFPHVDREIPFEHATTREELLGRVIERVRAGRRSVIKPQATGLGHGIEFFLEEGES